MTAVFLLHSNKTRAIYLPTVECLFCYIFLILGLCGNYFHKVSQHHKKFATLRGKIEIQFDTNQAGTANNRYIFQLYFTDNLFILMKWLQLFFTILFRDKCIRFMISYEESKPLIILTMYFIQNINKKQL